MRAETRFWDSVHFGADCWEWTAGMRTRKGYGSFWYNGKPRFAHRVAWELANGPIPDGMCVMHRCDNPKCVNPEHLAIGTVAENNADRERKGRGNQPRGSKNSKAKLTEDKVREIRRIYSDGKMSQTELGRLFGLGQSGISYVVSQGWAHV